MSDSTPTPPELPQKKSLGKGAKVAMGCGIGCLGVLVVGLILVAFLAVQAQKNISAAQDDLAALGLTPVESEGSFTVTITEPPTEPSYYMAGYTVIFDFDEPVTVPIGALAPNVEILDGTFEENVHLRGMVSVIVLSGTTFKKELNVETKNLFNDGTVEGEVTGNFKIVEID